MHLSSWSLRSAWSLPGGLLVCVTLLLPACVGSRTLSELPAREVSGYYTAGPDGQWFRPCADPDGDEMWWVTFTDRAAAQRETAPYADLLQAEEPVFVRWRAAMGDRAAGAPEGPGPGTRYALVREILDVQAGEAGSCPVE